jgi:8-hydroxy-5-deazaflavin:NADPH oxidoreductase
MTIGLIGAGHIGSQIARLAVAHGHTVVVSNSRGPETLSTLVEELGPHARAATAAEAALGGDIVVVTVPLKNYRDVPVEPLEGKIVIDTNNYYPERDGHMPELDNESTTRRSSCSRTCPRRRSSRRSTISTPLSSRPTDGRRARQTAVRWSLPATTLMPKRR